MHLSEVASLVLLLVCLLSLGSATETQVLARPKKKTDVPKYGDIWETSYLPRGHNEVELDLKALESSMKCECKEDIPFVFKLDNSDCYIPNRYRITKIDKRSNKMKTEGKKGPGLKVGEIEKQLGNIKISHMINVESASFACIDGRDSDRVGHMLRTPGGDFAEWVYLLTEYLDVGKSKHQELADAWLYEYIDQRRRGNEHSQFYFHTDADAVRQLMKCVQIAGPLLDMVNPPEHLQIKILQCLKTVPETHGCMHIRMMLKYPEKMGVTKKAIGFAIESYFKLLWRKDKFSQNGPLHNRLFFSMTEKKHKEKSMFWVRNSYTCLEEGVATLPKPTNDVYVIHRHAATYRRRSLAMFLAASTMDTRPLDDILDAIQQRALKGEKEILNMIHSTQELDDFDVLVV